MDIWPEIGPARFTSVKTQKSLILSPATTVPLSTEKRRSGGGAGAIDNGLELLLHRSSPPSPPRSLLSSMTIHSWKKARFLFLFLFCALRLNPLVGVAANSKLSGKRCLQKVKGLVKSLGIHSVTSSPVDSLRNGNWVKLICGASFEVYEQL